MRSSQTLGSRSELWIFSNLPPICKDTAYVHVLVQAEGPAEIQMTEAAEERRIPADTYSCWMIGVELLTSHFRTQLKLSEADRRFWGDSQHLDLYESGTTGSKLKDSPCSQSNDGPLSMAHHPPLTSLHSLFTRACNKVAFEKPPCCNMDQPQGLAISLLETRLMGRTNQAQEFSWCCKKFEGRPLWSLVSLR